jgi:hypothetical protein
MIRGSNEQQFLDIKVKDIKPLVAIFRFAYLSNAGLIEFN